MTTENQNQDQDISKTFFQIYLRWCQYANLPYDVFIANSRNQLVRTHLPTMPTVIKDNPILIGIKHIVRRLALSKTGEVIPHLDELTSICCLVIRHLVYGKQQLTPSQQFDQTHFLLSHPNNVKEILSDPELGTDNVFFCEMVDAHFDAIRAYVNYLMASRQYHLHRN